MVGRTGKKEISALGWCLAALWEYLGGQLVIGNLVPWGVILPVSAGGSDLDCWRVDRESSTLFDTSFSALCPLLVQRNNTKAENLSPYSNHHSRPTQ